VATHIRNATGTIHAIDGESLLTPQTLDQIVQAVVAALDDKKLRERRAKDDTTVADSGAQAQDGAA
jgi:hypothetical protein